MLIVAQRKLYCHHLYCLKMHLDGSASCKAAVTATTPIQPGSQKCTSACSKTIEWIETQPLSLCLCLCFPFHLWLHFWLLWKTFKRSHTHTYTWVSGEGTTVLFVSTRGRESELERTLFSNQALPANISPSELNGRERMYFRGDLWVCVCVERWGGGSRRMVWFWSCRCVCQEQKPNHSWACDPSSWSLLPFFAFSHCFPLFLSDLRPLF